MTTIIATIIVLGVLIFVHELGHFMAAKAVDVEVERFSIGIGPKVWGFRWGETEYVISAIPLGGFVKMGGMEDEVMEALEGGPTDEEREPGPRDFDGKPIWARTLITRPARRSGGCPSSRRTGSGRSGASCCRPGPAPWRTSRPAPESSGWESGGWRTGAT